MEDEILPNYGLEDLAGLDLDDDDTFNDDTFGDDVGIAEWAQGGENALEMSRLHEQFLSGDMSGAAVPGMPGAAVPGMPGGDAPGIPGTCLLYTSPSPRD